MSHDSTHDPLAGVVLWLTQHDIVVPRTAAGIESWRVLRVALSHPLYGHLPTGITDGVLCYCADVSGRVVHVTLGQCEVVKPSRETGSDDSRAAKSRGLRPKRHRTLSSDELADLV